MHPLTICGKKPQRKGEVSESGGGRKMEMKFINPHANRAISHRLPPSFLRRERGVQLGKEEGIRIMAAEVNLAERYPSSALSLSLSLSLALYRPKSESERVSSNVKELEKGRNRL